MSDGTAVQNPVDRLAATEAEHDAYLAELLGGDVTPEPAANPQPDVILPGTEASDPTPTTPAAEATEASDKPAAAPAAGGLSDDLLRALRRDGVPDAAIEGTDPATLLAWAQAAQKRQSDVDAYSERLRAAEARSTGQPDDEPAGDQPADVDESSDSDDADGNQPEAERQGTDPYAQFADLFGDDAAAPVREMADQARAAVARAEAAESKVAALSQTVDGLSKVVQFEQAARTTLAPYGQMDAGTLKRVGDRMDEITRANPETAKGTVESLMAAAARDVLGVSPNERGAPTPPRGIGSRIPRALTPEQENDIAAEMFASGATPEQVRRRLGKD